MTRAYEPERDEESRSHVDNPAAEGVGAGVSAARVDVTHAAHAKPGLRVYRSPRLTYIGTVREHTMGPGGSGTEGGFPKGSG